MKNYLKNTKLSEARDMFREYIGKNCTPVGEELISTVSALDRVTSRAVYAKISAPHYASCAMDGVALMARLTFGATESTPVLLSSDQYVPVDTGDPVPDGCDCVVMIEDVTFTEGGIKLYSASVPWQHVRQIGEDICAGEMLLPSGCRITPSAVGALLASGVTQLPVRRRLVAGFIPTGDEIVQSSSNPEKGEIIEFNSQIISSLIRAYDIDTTTYPVVSDKLDSIILAIGRAAAECDIVLLCAGSSAGREDLAALALQSTGETLLHGVAIRPGKPALLGSVRGKPFIGLPGYPVSAVIVAEQFVSVAAEVLGGLKLRLPQTVTAVTATRLNSSLKYEEFVRVRLGCIGGKLIATQLQRGAGVVTSIVKADGLIRVPQDSEHIEAGQPVEVTLLRELEEIQGTICVIGSHDPALDELSDLAVIGTDFRISSSHVGSMGGILAQKRGQAHISGIHLLDPQDGSYNVSCVRQNFPSGGVRLMRGFGRTQGFIIKPGNPLGINTVKDLTRDSVRFVNRQKGAGTRLLLDHLLCQAGISSDLIYGYTREEYTHISVATQIASGEADSGLGILSAARTLGLDFVPVAVEQYDFLIAETFAGTPHFEAFRDLLVSSEFLDRLSQMGGYSTDGIGEWVQID